MARPAAIKPRAPIPPGRRVHTLLLPEHFAEALAAAGIDRLPNKQSLEAVTISVDPFVQAVLSGQVSPPVGAFHRTIDALAAVESGCAAALTPVLTPLPVPMPHEEAALARALGDSLDPLIVALSDAAATCGGDNPEGRLLADTMLAVDRLRAWAVASRTQFETGLSRERFARAAPEAQSPPRDLGFALIRIYLELTGQQQPCRSRALDKNGEIRPGGPLIRYLEHLFRAAHEQLGKIPEQAGLARNRGWTPSPETLVAWIKEFRRAD